jgi:nucleotide-binding universal stress UspA family protein
MKTILVATDFSERSDRALRRATLLAKQSGATLSLVHVVDDDQPRRIVDSERQAATELLHEQAGTLRDLDGVACDARVIMADPFAGIVRAVERSAPDLLVLGPHRRQALRDMFVGTTAERTIRSVTCPILMANGPPVGPYHHVLLATDFSVASRQAADTLTSLGLASTAHQSILHVFDAPALRLAMSHTLGEEGRREQLEEARREADGALAAFARRLEGQWDDLIVRHQRVSPASEILAAAAELSADCIVLGTRRTGLAKVLLGSVAEEVLRNSGRDVLAVPPAVT